MGPELGDQGLNGAEKWGSLLISATGNSLAHLCKHLASSLSKV